jgi:rubrerythrin
MSIDFNADEIFEIAEQIERNGINFYRTVAEKVKESDKKQLLIELAEMEVEHERTFKSLRSQLTSDEKIQITFDPEGNSERYLRALADTRVFYKKKLTLHHMRIFLNLQ